MELQLQDLTAADVMLATPKTLPADTAVAEAREMLANDHVTMLLLTEGATFRGAVTSLPDDADPASPAVAYADEATETIPPTEAAELAYERSRANPHRRLVVLDEDGALLGLVCLNKAHTGFCNSGSRGDH